MADKVDNLYKELLEFLATSQNAEAGRSSYRVSEELEGKFEEYLLTQLDFYVIIIYNLFRL